MFALSTAPSLMPMYSLAAWLCSAVALFILATMIPPKWRRVLQATGTALVIGGFFIANPYLWVPDCDGADLLTWLAIGCYFLS